MINGNRSRATRHLFKKLNYIRPPASENFIPDYGRGVSLTFPFLHEKKELSKIPGPTGVWRLGTSPYYWFNIGNYSVPKYFKTLQHLHRTYGDVVREERWEETIIHLYNPEDIKTVHRYEGKYPTVVPLSQTTREFRKDEDMSLGLGNINGEEWYNLRHKVRFFSKVKNVEMFFLQPTNIVLNEFIELLRKKTSDNGGFLYDFMKDLERWNLEAAALVIFEKSLGLLTDDPPEMFLKFIDTVLEHSQLNSIIQFQSVKLNKLLNSNKWKKLMAVEQFRNRVIAHLLQDAIKEMARKAETGNFESQDFTFLRRLMQHQNKTEKESLSDVQAIKSKHYDDLLILALSVFGDGLITTTPMACCLIYNLATNPETQEKCYQEIISAVGSAENIDPSMLNELRYLKACLKESMRLYPNNTEAIRILNDDVVLGGWDIPSGTVLHNNTFAALRSPKYFQRPDDFIPERWLKGQQQDLHPFLHLSFSHGTRQCAGRRVALQDLYCLTIKLLQNFKIELCGDYQMEMVYQTLMSPAKPVNFHFTFRK